MKKEFFGGFTLIELLVAIAIIALLTGIVITNISSSRGKARDAKRISDIGQMQLAIELFFDRCKMFPQEPLDVANSSCTVSGNTILLANYLPKIPVPPAGTTYDYFVSSTRTDYFLHVTLESANSVVRDGMAAVPPWYTAGAVTCSDAATSVDYCLSSK